MSNILICSSPDLNYIDGSSIWAQTITLAFAENKEVMVDFLAKSQPERYELYNPLYKKRNIKIVDGTDKSYWSNKHYRRLSSEQMADLTIRLDKEKDYDVIIVRGLDIAKRLLDDCTTLNKCWLYLTDIPQQVDEYDDSFRELMRKLAQCCELILCQTSGFVSLWKQLVPNISNNKFKLYTPVIPDIDEPLIPVESRKSQVVYAGKFKSDWKTLEMTQLWEVIHKQQPNSNLVMIGDKIHHEKNDSDYYQTMLNALEEGDGIQWVGAKSREEVQEILKASKIGLSWRSEDMNDSLEYSTKILEYGGAGCAAIINRNPLHESLLGSDYPLFVNSSKEFLDKLILALTNDTVLKLASSKMYELAKNHIFSIRVKELATWLREVKRTRVTSRKRKKTILVAGHDLKFFTPLQRKLEKIGDYHFIVDLWQGHNKHDEAQSLKLLDQADIIFCEWCLGNLEWYSKNKKKGQKLIARFHAQESKLPYLGNSDLDAIDHISFVSEHIREEALKSVPNIPLNKTSIIANYLDNEKFTPLKKVGDAQFALGMIGVTPKSKRLDRAIDLLEMLLKKDNRYYLRIKGKNPLSYPWIHNRPDEIEYYKNIFLRINNNPILRYKVIFDPPGDDVNQWLSLIGYILSPSDNESFHMAVGEGILTGCYPIIWDWHGAKQVWGEEFVVKDVKEASAIVLSNNKVDLLKLFYKNEFHDVIDRWEKQIKGNK